MAKESAHEVIIGSHRSRRIEVKPQQIVVLPFLIVNTTRDSVEFLEEIKLPKGWRLLIPTAPFRLGPGGSRVRLISVSVPVAAPAGRYRLSYRFVDARDPSVWDELNIECVVLTDLQVDILQEKVPDRVIAGQAYEALFRVANQSNVPIEAKIRVTGSHGIPVTVSAKSFRLEPQSSRLLSLTVKTGRKIRRSFMHRLILELSAKSSGQEGDDPARGSFRSTSQTRVLPRVSRGADPYHRLSGTLRTTVRREFDEKITLLEWSGSGFLDRARDVRLDILLRQPIQDTRDVPSGFEREYRMSLLASSATLYLGDRGYTLTELTERSKFGRGAEFGVDTGALRFGGYVLKSRFDSPQEKQAAGYAGLRWGERLGVDLAYLKKKA